VQHDCCTVVAQETLITALVQVLTSALQACTSFSLATGETFAVRNGSSTSISAPDARLYDVVLNRQAKTGHSCRFGINLNRCSVVRDTRAYGMFTQWVRSNLMWAC
jgi:hypothetical protein